MAKASDNIFPHVLVVEGAAPSTASSGTYPGIVSGDQALFIDSSTHHLKRVNSAGTVVDIEAGGGGGAPTTDKYLLQAADVSTLPNAIVLPGSAGWADVAGQLPPGITSSGTPITEEYDSGTNPITWTAAAAAGDTNTTVKSHLYANFTDTSEHLGLRSWAPAGAFDVSCHLSLAPNPANNCSAGLIVTDSGNSNRAMILVATALTGSTPSFNLISYTYASGAYTFHGTQYALYTYPRYLRLTRDGSNNISYYWSHDGIAWQLAETFSFTLTVANVGYRTDGGGAGAAAHSIFSDWMRTNI